MLVCIQLYSEVQYAVHLVDCAKVKLDSLICPPGLFGDVPTSNSAESFRWTIALKTRHLSISSFRCSSAEW